MTVPGARTIAADTTTDTSGTDTASTDTTASRPTTATVRARWRGGRWIALLGALMVLVAVVGVLLGPEQEAARPLDPDDTSLTGSKALAELLRDRGVAIDRVDSPEEAAALGGDRLLLITDTLHFNAYDLAAIRGDRLIVNARFSLHALAPGVRNLGPARPRSREPECRLPAAVAAGSAYVGGTILSLPAGGTGCYPAGDGWTLVSYPNAGGTTTLAGGGDFMTNQRLAEDGNAALALNLIGTGKPVTWLVPPDNPPAGELAGPEGKSLTELMPASIPWALLMAFLTVVLTAFWRGRRLGPVVVERLPVVVRASETVEGRGRLYRARRARDRAADSLRAGTIDRLTPRLGLASGADRHEVVAALAVRTGLDPQEVGGALYGPPPAGDEALVALAGYLDSIERKVSEL
jgi:hypothetical protein